MDGNDNLQEGKRAYMALFIPFRIGVGGDVVESPVLPR